MHLSLVSKLSSASGKTSIPSTTKENAKTTKKKTIKPALLCFDVDLDLISQETYTHLNLKQMILDKQSQKQKRAHNPFGEEDSEDEVARIAAKYVQKYGSSYGIDGYVDKGEGYDETDPFVDNSEAYDELIPNNLDTEYGGFYINTGELKFKSIGGIVEPEDEFEKATLLQKLKRKRNKVSDEEIQDKPPKTTKTKTVKPPQQKQQPTQPTQQPKLSKKVVVAANAKANTNAMDVQLIEIRKKPESKVLKTTKVSDGNESKSQRKSKKDDSMVFPQASSKNNNATSSGSLTAAASKASLSQNLFSTKIQQMITDSLLGNLTTASNNPAANTNNFLSACSTMLAAAQAHQQNTQQASSKSSASSAAIASLNLLKHNLFAAKVPYEIISLLPNGKAKGNDGKLTSEWNKYLLEIVKKTQTVKNRQKIFELLANYLNVTRDELYLYAQNLDSSLKYLSMGNIGGQARAAATPSTSNSPSYSLQQQQSVSLLGNHFQQPASQMKKSISSSSSSQQNHRQASSDSPVNLSTNQQTFSEGLAGKLINQTSIETTNQQSASTSSSSSSSSNKSNHQKVTGSNALAKAIYTSNKPDTPIMLNTLIQNYVAKNSQSAAAGLQLSNSVTQISNNHNSRNLSSNSNSQQQRISNSGSNQNSLLSFTTNQNKTSLISTTNSIAPISNNQLPPPPPSSSSTSSQIVLSNLIKLPDVFNNPELIHRYFETAPASGKSTKSQSPQHNFPSVTTTSLGKSSSSSLLASNNKQTANLSAISTASFPISSASTTASSSSSMFHQPQLSSVSVLNRTNSNSSQHHQAQQQQTVMNKQLNNPTTSSVISFSTSNQQHHGDVIRKSLLSNSTSNHLNVTNQPSNNPGH